MSCGSGADAFIEKHFKDCVYNARDYIGFCLGLAAIAFWIIAQLPQYYRNYKTKSAEALSPWFLAQWLLGDTFNLIGALLQGQQLPTTVYTAMYFVIADVFMMMQYIYYGALQRRRERVMRLQARRRHHHHHHHPRKPRQHDGSSTHEHEALLSPEPGQRPLAGDLAQQQQQESASRSLQQQERRRLPHSPGVQLSGSQHARLELDCEGLSGPGDTNAAGQLGSSQPQSCEQQSQPQQAQPGQQQQQCAQGAESDQDFSSSSACSSPRSGSSHSSSKRVRPLDTGSSPSRGAPVVAQSTTPLGCGAAAAAASLGGIRSIPGAKLLGGGAHWGGIRSVVAVAVLVTLGLVSLLPASTTRGLYTGSTPGPLAYVLHHAQAASSPARAMQAGVQQQQQQLGGSQQLPTATLPGSAATVQAAAVGSSPGGGTGHGSDTGESSSTSRGWARQKRVGDAQPEHNWSFIVGTGLGYVASVLYLCSRVSQIHKNYTRKSSEGLALVMFIMAVCANLCTGTSIILRTFTWTELKEQLPWVIGSLGTISLDMVILWQSTLYSKEGQQLGVGDGAHVHSSRHPHHHHHQHHPHAERDRQPSQLQGHHHHTVDVGAGTAAGLGSPAQQAGAGLADGSAVLDNMPLAPHHRSGALLGRRHAAAATKNDVLVDGPEVAAPLMSSSGQR